MSTPAKPSKPSPDFPLFPHACGQWAKKVKGKLRYFGPWSDPDAALRKYQGESKSISRPGRPQKPHPDFPLFPHACGQWCKKVKGVFHYFGPWADPDAALNRWREQKDDILAGHTPQTTTGATLRDLANAFCKSKRRRVELGKLAERTWYDYFAICETILKTLGPHKPIAALSADDFEKLYGVFARGNSPKTLQSYIGRARTVFKYASDKELVDKPVKFFGNLDKPSKADLRRDRREKLFSGREIHRLLRAASPQLRAMILLGINCGLGNNDCALLTTDHIKGRWLDYERPKTGCERRAILWPETLRAIKQAMSANPKPAQPEYAKYVFLTRRGSPWTPKSKSGHDSPVSKEMKKLLNRLGIVRPGLGFYALRHTFQTVANDVRDREAIRCVMGHVEDSGDMSAHYTERLPSITRLWAVANHVRRWLVRSNPANRRKVDDGREQGQGSAA